MSAAGGARQLPWIFDDGGRARAGFKGSAGDCVARAIAIASGRSYGEVYRELSSWQVEAAEADAGNTRKRRKVRRHSARDGVAPSVIRAYLADRGWSWTPTMGIGTGTTVHLLAGEIPMRGPVVCRLSRHIVAVVDGVIRDTFDPSREGTRAVYGYWVPPLGWDRPGL